MMIETILCAAALILNTPDAAPQQPQTAETTNDIQQTSATIAESDEKELNGVKVLAIEANIVSYTNEERARYGLPPLEVD
jgi:uncharacterized protein YkwD